MAFCPFSIWYFFSDRSGDLEDEKPEQSLIQLNWMCVSGLELLRIAGWKDLIIPQASWLDLYFWPFCLYRCIRWKIALERMGKEIWFRELADACGEGMAWNSESIILLWDRESSRLRKPELHTYIAKSNWLNYWPNYGENLRSLVWRRQMAGADGTVVANEPEL